MTSTALATTSPTTATLAFEPRSIPEALTLAQTLYESGMFPKMRSAAAVFAVVAAGREIGLPALQSLRALHFYDGKVSLSSDLMQALVRRSSVCTYFKLKSSTDKECTYETQREDGTPVAMTWTIEQAKTAQLTDKDNWKKYPRAMLRARCGADLCRAEYPDVCMGLYDGDELGEVTVVHAPATEVKEVKDAEFDEVVTPPPPLSPIVGMYVGRLKLATSNAEVDGLSKEASAEGLTIGERTALLAAFAETRQRLIASEVKK